jgi:hypothetical protein
MGEFVSSNVMKDFSADFAVGIKARTKTAANGLNVIASDL